MRTGRTPWGLLLPAALAAVFLVVPLLALGVRTPWGSLDAVIGDPEVRSALWLSVETSTLAALICLLLGLPLVWLLTRATFPGRSVLRGLVIVPVVMPPVVAGVALLSAFGRVGVLGGPLYHTTGLTIPFTMPAVVVSHVFVALPFFVLSAEGAVHGVPASLELAAASLGSSRWRTFWRVTVPLARPGIVAGLVLAWARSLGEFGATITFAGNYPGTTRTLPLEIYTQLAGNSDTAYVVSAVLLAVSLLVLVGLRDRWLGGLTR